MIVYPSIKGRLQHQHESIDLLLARIDPERLHFRPSPEKWSMQDIIAHLTRYQSIFAERVTQILRDDRPEFSRYSADDDPEFDMYRTIDTYTLLQQLTYERELIYRKINKLKDAEYARIGIHATFGTLTVLQWTEFFLLHEAHHLFALFKLANAR